MKQFCSYDFKQETKFTTFCHCFVCGKAATHQKHCKYGSLCKLKVNNVAILYILEQENFVYKTFYVALYLLVFFGILGHVV